MKKRKQILIDTSKCIGTGCRMCVRICSRHVLKMENTDEQAYPYLVSPNKCSNCGNCAYICPADAISLEEQSEDNGISKSLFVEMRKYLGLFS